LHHSIFVEAIVIVHLLVRLVRLLAEHLTIGRRSTHAVDAHGVSFKSFLLLFPLVWFCLVLTLLKDIEVTLSVS